MFADVTDVFQWLRRYRTEADVLSASPSRRQVTEPVGVEQDENYRRLSLNLPALYGRFGILPDYFTDDLQILGEDGDALRDFLDIFNHRLFDTLFQIWFQNQFFGEDALEGRTEKGRDEAFFLNRLAGNIAPLDKPAYVKGLNWNKMAAFRKRVRSREGLRSLIQSMFPELDFEIETFVSVVRPIPEDQRPVLGKTALVLGLQGNLLTGLSLSDPCGGIRLAFRDLTYKQFIALQDGGETRRQMESLVGHFTRDSHLCLLRLELRPEEVPSWQLGGPPRPDARLGRSLWLKSQPTLRPERVDAGALDTSEERQKRKDVGPTPDAEVYPSGFPLLSVQGQVRR